MPRWTARVAEQLTRWRHIAYRIKARHLHGSNVYRSAQRALWPAATRADGLGLLFRQQEPDLAAFPLDTISDQVVRVSYAANNRRWACVEHDVSEARGNILIEAKNSLAIIGGNHLIESTRGVHREMVPNILSRINLRTKSMSFPELIHFDGFIGTNLYHFVADGLNAFLALKQRGFAPLDIPLLINRKVADVAYVRELRSLPCFDGHVWKVQEKGEIVRTKRLVKGIASLSDFRLSYDLFAERVTKNPTRRIFLDRSNGVQRRLINNDEIAPILEKYGFETVLAENLAYPDQMALFAQASHVVALHGAGMTNLLYCDLPQTRVLELTSVDLLNPHFYWMANVIGVGHYDVIAGSPFNRDWNYTIDLRAFESGIRKLVEH